MWYGLADCNILCWHKLDMSWSKIYLQQWRTLLSALTFHKFIRLCGHPQWDLLVKKKKKSVIEIQIQLVDLDIDLDN